MNISLSLFCLFHIRFGVFSRVQHPFVSQRKSALYCSGCTGLQTYKAIFGLQVEDIFSDVLNMVYVKVQHSTNGFFNRSILFLDFAIGT